MQQLIHWLEKHPSERIVIFGYLMIIMTGFGLLSIPVAQEKAVSPLDNLFTAASALSTTGLSTLDIGSSYTFFGELIILSLMQIGGIGYMVIGSYIIIGRKGRLSHAGVKLLKMDFALPEKYDILHFVKDVLVFSVLIEMLGTLTLWLAFVQVDIPNPLWAAIFHSVSAFCTAGFSLFPESISSFQSNLPITITLSLLAFGGAIGFIVFSDIINLIRKTKSKITLTSRIILLFTLLTFLMSVVLLCLDINVRQEKLLIGFFQAASALTTAGFSTFPSNHLASSSIIVILLLMIVGASPSGTGGGLKSTTIAALFYQMLATVRRMKKVTVMKKEVPEIRLRLASSQFFFYLSTLAAGIIILLFIETGQSIVPVVFETTSALGTVGLSMGITASLHPVSKCLIMVLMFLGRIGPLTLGIALTKTYPGKAEGKEDIAV